MASDLRRRLREATAADHQRLEDRLDIFTRVSTTGGRRALVAGFYRLHAGAEAATIPRLANIADLHAGARRRTPLLLADLDALGEPVPAPAQTTGGDSLGAALGWMYVLEGSTLGGKVIRRRLEERGQTMSGLSFLDPYGAEGGAMWRAFLEVLERDGADNADQVIEGALAGFRQAEAVLCGADVPA